MGYHVAVAECRHSDHCQNEDHHGNGHNVEDDSVGEGATTPVARGRARSARGAVAHTVSRDDHLKVEEVHVLVDIAAGWQCVGGVELQSEVSQAPGGSIGGTRERQRDV